MAEISATASVQNGPGVLFVNACIRDGSRTKRLADALLGKLGVEAVQRDLSLCPIAPLDKIGLENRENGGQNGFALPCFDIAKEFSKADVIVIAAPYWDLSFPAVLKAYLESVCICGLTFFYGEDGLPHSLCRAKKLIYVTTSGGYIGELNFGYDYVKGICKSFFGIDDTEFISAQGLDIIGNDADEIMNGTINSLKNYDLAL